MLLAYRLGLKQEKKNWIKVRPVNKRLGYNSTNNNLAVMKEFVTRHDSVVCWLVKNTVCIAKAGGQRATFKS